jgi:hypothetical protein
LGDGIAVTPTFCAISYAELTVCYARRPCGAAPEQLTSFDACFHGGRRLTLRLTEIIFAG